MSSMTFSLSQRRLLFLAGAAFSAVLCLAHQNDPGPPPKTTQPAALVESGKSAFQEKCSFCHGRDAGGGETGPDLTASDLVAEDVAGDKIGVVVRNGRQEKGMPRFDVTTQEISALSAFIHHQKQEADSQQGGRKGVDIADLQTGNAASGQKYFVGAGGCSSCHSASGDLAGVGTRFKGLKLEQRLLYPGGSLPKATVTLSSGKTISGILAYQDEWTIGVRDPSGWYQSWPVSEVKFQVNDPVQAHVDLLPRYTDANIHDLMAYLQTLQAPAKEIPASHSGAKQ